MNTLSMDLRQRIIDAYDEGAHTRQEIADLFMVSLGMVKKLLAQRARTGDISPQHHRAGRPRKLTADDQARLSALVAKQPDATLTELREGAGLKCHLSTIHRTLKRLKLSFKKNGRGARRARSPRRGRAA